MLTEEAAIGSIQLWRTAKRFSVAPERGRHMHLVRRISFQHCVLRDQALRAFGEKYLVAELEGCAHLAALDQVSMGFENGIDLLGIGHVFSVEYAAPDCTKREDFDLCAQRRMAVAAEEQSLLNKIGLAFLLGTLAFTGWTMNAAVRAAKAAEDSAATADKTLRSIENTSKLELRARLSVLAGGVNQLIGENLGMGHVALRNVGKLPARNVSLLGGHDAVLRESKFDVPPDNERLARVVQPGTEMSQDGKTTIPLLDLRTANRYVYVWGVAYYDDGYGSRRATRFCHRYATRAHDRSTDWSTEALETRPIIASDRARYHTAGNDAN